MRILFSRPAQTMYTTKVEAPFLMGVPLPSGTTIGTHVKGYAMTGNKGNMIHRLAMLQLLKYDRNNSVQCNLSQLHNSGRSLEWIRDFIRDNFDQVIFTFSNIIRPGISDGALGPILHAIDVPIVAVGVGLQERLSKGTEDLQADTIQLLRILNEKCSLFGVRGHTTQEWCHANGFEKAVAIGCPSMFVYPRSIASMQPLAYDENLRVMTAGHLHPRLLTSWKLRISTLFEALPLARTSYVFQSELPEFKTLLDAQGVYNEARSEIEASFFNNHLRTEFGIAEGFNRYYCFNEPSAWRQAAAMHDIFVGDRIHGGVAAMQAGVPSMVLHEDVRVKELTAFHGIPNSTVSHFGAIGFEAAIEKYLSPEAIATFKSRYAITLRNFSSKLGQAGLSMANALDVKEVLLDQKNLVVN